MEEIIELDAVDKYNKLFGLETRYPPVSMEDLSKAIRWLEHSSTNYWVYALFLKNTRCREYHVRSSEVRLSGRNDLQFSGLYIDEAADPCPALPSLERPCTGNAGGFIRIRNEIRPVVLRLQQRDIDLPLSGRCIRRAFDFLPVDGCIPPQSAQRQNPGETSGRIYGFPVPGKTGRAPIAPDAIILFIRFITYHVPGEGTRKVCTPSGTTKYREIFLIRIIGTTDNPIKKSHESLRFHGS